MSNAIVALVQLVPNLVNLATSLVSSAGTAKSNAQLIEFQSALINLQSLIASVQQENATLASQKGDLEEELKRLKDWDAEKLRYKLAIPYSGVTVYALQRAMSNGEPPHYICANCFEGRKRSMLANTTNKEGWIAVVCAVCKFSAQTRYRAIGQAKYFEDIDAPE